MILMAVNHLPGLPGKYEPKLDPVKEKPPGREERRRAGRAFITWLSPARLNRGPIKPGVRHAQ